ncbi:MAG: MFS transporter [Thermoleophilia bacterium]|nr:MFS transporter [Thermoleophilia bacterium]
MGAQTGSAALTLGLPALGPQFRSELGVSLVGVGALLAAPTIGYMFTMFLWGALSDRVGERPVMVTGLAGSAIVLAVASAQHHPWTLGPALALAGSFGAAAPAASGRAVVAWFPPDQRGLALGLRHTSPMIGGAVGAIALTVASARWGIGGAMLTLAVLAMIGATAAVGVPAAPWDGAGAVRPARPHPVADRLVWVLAAAGGLVIVGQAVLLRFQPVYLHDERGWGGSATAALLSLTLLGAAVARVIAGLVSDRLDRRIPVLAGQAIGAGALILVAALLLAAPSVVAATLLSGATVLTMAGNGVAYAAIAEAVPDRTGAALGMYSTVLIVVVSLAPPLFGLVADRVTWALGFTVVGLFPLAATLLLIRAERHQAARRVSSV